MHKKAIWQSALILLSAALLVHGQEAQQSQEAAAPPAPASPVAKQPSIKSQKELEAIQAIFQAVGPELRIKAAEDLIANFKDTEFKAIALQMCTISAQELNDYERTMVYGERTLEADPENYQAMLAMAGTIAQKIGKFDLDKEEKLARVNDLTSRAMKILETAPRPNENVTDEIWASAKNNFRAEAHQALGIAALANEEFEKAVTAFKQAVDLSGGMDPAVKVRLAVSYNRVGNYNEAIVVLDEVLAEPDLHPGIQNVAQAEKLNAMKLKEAKQTGNQ